MVYRKFIVICDIISYITGSRTFCNMVIIFFFLRRIDLIRIENADMSNVKKVNLSHLKLKSEMRKRPLR